jgi:hypothetical protein
MDPRQLTHLVAPDLGSAIQRRGHIRAIDRYLALWPLLRPRFSPDSAKSENRMVISVQSDVFIVKILVFVMK